MSLYLQEKTVFHPSYLSYPIVETNKTWSEGGIYSSGPEITDDEGDDISAKTPKKNDYHEQSKSIDFYPFKMVEQKKAVRLHNNKGCIRSVWETLCCCFY